MSDKELDNYIKIINPDFNSHIEKGTIEMNNEYYNLLEEKMARLINQNQELKEKYLNAVTDYETTMSERNQLKKQLKNMTDNYCNASKLKHERASKIVEMNNQQKKLKEQLENSIKVNIADHKYASECEDKVVTLEAHQKEFTKWLEDEIHTIKTTFSQINGNYGLMNEKLEALKEVLRKYKKIIGGNE